MLCHITSGHFLRCTVTVPELVMLIDKLVSLFHVMCIHSSGTTIFHLMCRQGVGELVSSSYLTFQVQQVTSVEIEIQNTGRAPVSLLWWRAILHFSSYTFSLESYMAEEWKWHWYPSLFRSEKRSLLSIIWGDTSNKHPSYSFPGFFRWG